MSETLAALLDGPGGATGADIVLFDRGVPVEAGRFRAEVVRIAGGLAALGIRPGDRVAIWLPNVPAWLATLFALARLGAVAVSVNTRFRSHELAMILRRARPRALVYWPGFNGIDFAGILKACDPAALTSVLHLVEYGEAGPPAAERDGVDMRGIARIDFAALPAEDSPDHAAKPSLLSSNRDI